MSVFPVLTSSSHYRWVKQESELARQEAAQVSGPKLDLGFKEGQTIKINIGVRKKTSLGHNVH